jgi:hypothetical protein
MLAAMHPVYLLGLPSWTAFKFSSLPELAARGFINLSFILYAQFLQCLQYRQKPAHHQAALLK